jgi:hypothetical protein
VWIPVICSVEFDRNRLDLASLKLISLLESISRREQHRISMSRVAPSFTDSVRIELTLCHLFQFTGNSDCPVRFANTLSIFPKTSRRCPIRASIHISDHFFFLIYFIHIVLTSDGLKRTWFSCIILKARAICRCRNDFPASVHRLVKSIAFGCPCVNGTLCLSMSLS